jgi:hypothetical protein
VSLDDFVAGGGVVYVRIMQSDLVDGLEPGALHYQASAEAWQSDGRWAQWVGNGDSYEEAVRRALGLAQAPHQEPPAPTQWIPYDAAPAKRKVVRRVKHR